jgi:serine/threonine protein kinase
MDIKLDNFVLTSDLNVALIDFGCSEYQESNPLNIYKVGTVPYRAPEVGNIRCGKYLNLFKADVYSLGITMFSIIRMQFPIINNDHYNRSNDQYLGE